MNDEPQQDGREVWRRIGQDPRLQSWVQARRTAEALANDPDMQRWLGEPTRQQQAAETKKRRTRLKLVQACDELMQEDMGWFTTVEAICEKAGVSTATFYSVYNSRNDVCREAFEYLVDQLEEAGLQGSFAERAQAIADVCAERSNLVRGALSARLGQERSAPGRTPDPVGVIVTVDGQKSIELSYAGNFVDQVARLLVEPALLDDVQNEAQFMVALRMTALYLLDSIATYQDADYGLLERVFLRGCINLTTLFNQERASPVDCHNYSTFAQYFHRAADRPICDAVVLG